MIRRWLHRLRMGLRALDQIVLDGGISGPVPVLIDYDQMMRQVRANFARLPQP